MRLPVPLFSLTLVLLAGCAPPANVPSRDGTETSRALDRAAIASGQLPDPGELSAEGAYGAQTDIGEDRLCVVDGENGLSVGLVVSYGSGGACSGRGTAEHSGNRLRMVLTPDCRFDARLDNDGVTLPGVLPPACQSLCRGRASLAGVAIPKVSDDLASALALTGLDNRPLCQG